MTFAKSIFFKAMFALYEYLKHRNIYNPNELVGNEDLSIDIQTHFFADFLVYARLGGNETLFEEEIFDIITNITIMITANKKGNPVLLRFKKYIHDLHHDDVWVGVDVVSYCDMTQTNLFTWVPLDYYSPSNKTILAHNKVMMSLSPTLSSVTTEPPSSPTMSFVLDTSGDEWSSSSDRSPDPNDEAALGR